MNSRLLPAAWWVLFSSYCSAAGWLLSSMGCLNRVGYAIAFGAGGFLAFGLHGSGLLRFPGFGLLSFLGVRPSSFRLRCSARRLLPAFFVFYAFLALLGGALYPPRNYDGLTYRLPRLLHWLSEERWQWIATNIPRMNISATGFEWLMAPIVALTRSERPLFLLNVISFLLLPGLVFGTFTRLGVNKRVAWYWMWLLPCGYCFVTQAGGIGNDMISAVFFLTAICFTLRARSGLSSSSSSDARNVGRGTFLNFAIGVLAIALVTGAKASNLPLLLPWTLAALPCLKLVRARPVSCALLLVVAASISFLPIACANARFSGDWAGDPQNRGQLKVQGPVYGLVGNSLLILVGNAQPPVAPFAKSFNAKMKQHCEGSFWERLRQHYPRFRLEWGELVQEESAGAGLGLFALLILTALVAFRRHPASSAPHSALRTPHSAFLSLSSGFAICLGTWVALLAYMAKMGSESAPRLVAPYYPLLFASILLLPGVNFVVRRRWWHWAALLAALSILPPVILSASRPLWPAQTASKWLLHRFPANPLVRRTASVYEVYASRSDPFQPLMKYLPPEFTGRPIPSAPPPALGFVGTEDDPETSLWFPIGSRRVVDVTPENVHEVLGKAVSVAFVSTRGLQETWHCTAEEWVAANHVRLIGREPLTLKVSNGPCDWLIVSCPPP